MAINVGDRLPDVPLTVATPDGPEQTTSTDFFAGRRVALFAVPGAYTPTCSARHLPGFKDKHDELKAKGVDRIVGVSVNDPFVMGAWAEQQGLSGDDVMLVADGNGDFTKKLGLELDATGFGMGHRSQRYSMLIKDGVVTELNVEQGGEFKVSSAEHLLTQLS